MGQVSMIEDLQTRLEDALHERFWPEYRDGRSERLPEHEFRKVILRVSKQAFDKFEKYTVEDSDAVALALDFERQIRSLESQTLSLEHGRRQAEAKLEQHGLEVSRFVDASNREIEAFKSRYKAACVGIYEMEIVKRNNIIKRRERQLAELQARLRIQGISAASKPDASSFDTTMRKRGTLKLNKQR